MAEAKKYTLTRKGSVTGPAKNPYHYERGDVINQDQYNKLVKRHKDQFEEGVKGLKKETKADVAQNKRLAELEERVTALERIAGVSEAETESDKEESKDDSKKDEEKPDSKKDDGKKKADSKSAKK